MLALQPPPDTCPGPLLPGARGHDRRSKPMSHTLSLCMIVKNESKNLPRCLASVEGLVDEIAVVDTGSTDNTVQKAKELGAAVHHYQWDQNFGNARNFALSKATGSWVLLLDADEQLEKADHPKVRQLLANENIDGAHFIIHNYMGREVSDNCTLHGGLRLLRNNGEYHFEGAIHEQIARRDQGEIAGRLPMADVNVYHYGYMDDEAASKQKRLRNIPILEKQLEADPQNPFVLFNLGNEHLAMGDHAAAFDIYEKAFEGMDSRRAYAPHLIRRMICCCQSLYRYDEALELVAKGLALYPACTDFEYARADTYQTTRRYTLAIESFERCLEMGEAPPPLRFVAGCGGYRANMALGELYFGLGDYHKAIAHFNRVLTQAPGRYGVLYRIGAALHRLLADPQAVYDRLCGYFAEPAYPPNVIVSSDILLGQGITAPVASAIAAGRAGVEYPDDFCYLAGRHAFLTGDFAGALGLFEQLLTQSEPAQSILPGLPRQAALYAFVASLALGQKEPGRLLHFVRRYCGDDSYAICLQLHYIRLGSTQKVLTPAQSGKNGLAVALDLLGRVLEVGQHNLFERLQPILNLLDSKTALLRLAGLYEARGMGPLAASCVLRSVREQGSIDRQGADILWRQVY